MLSFGAVAISKYVLKLRSQTLPGSHAGELDSTSESLSSSSSRFKPSTGFWFLLLASRFALPVFPLISANAELTGVLLAAEKPIVAMMPMNALRLMRLLIDEASCEEEAFFYSD